MLNTGIKKMLDLSSIGGHTHEGVGMLAAHHLTENMLDKLPVDVSIKTMPMN